MGPGTNSSNAEIGFLMSSIDAHKEHTNDRQQSDDTYRALFDHSLDAILLCEPQGIVVAANRAACAMFRMTEQEIYDTGSDLADRNDLRRAFALEELGRTGKFKGETTFIRKDGSKFVGEVVSVLLPDGRSTFVVIRDVSERIEAEARQRKYVLRVEHLAHDLIESQALLSALFDNTPDMVWTVDPVRFGLMSFNPAFSNNCREIGIEIKSGMPLGAILPPERAKQWCEFYERALNRGAFDTYYATYASNRFLHLSFNPLVRDGEVFGISVFGHDITQLKQAESKLASLLGAIEQAGEIIVITDLNANIKYANPAFERVTGYSLAEVIGKNPRILNSGMNPPELYRDLWDTLLRGETWTGRLINRKKDGSTWSEEATIAPVRDQDGKIVSYAAVKLDVTNQVELEQQLRQSQKLESIGTLAGGVAHDMNNILQSILLSSQVLLLSEHNPDVCEKLESMITVAQRGASIVHQLLTFSRQQGSAPCRVEVNKALNEIQRMLRHLIREDIAIEVTFGVQPIFVMVDPAQLVQVIMNLAVNAQDAMSSGGELTISATTGVFRMGDDLPARPVAEIKVKDTGVGVPCEMMDKIFEPFFTTKDVGKGTGLGLSMVHGIVTHAGGSVHVSSKPGCGATFTIRLPLCEPDLESVEVNPTSTHATGRILLVEDDEQARKAVEGVLKLEGYEVISMADPVEAAGVEITRINALITDLIMPGLGGIELARALRQASPDLPALFMSGYSKDSDQLLGLTPQDIFLQKPFSSNTLLSNVRRLLSSTPDEASC